MQALVARIDQGGHRHAAGDHRMVLLLLRDRLAGLVPVEFDQHMTVRGDVFVFRAVLGHRIDPQEQPELGAENAVDAAFLGHLGFPLGGRERDTTARGDLAVIGFHGRRNRHEFIRLKARVEQADESVVDGGWQRHGGSLSVGGDR